MSPAVVKAAILTGMSAPRTLWHLMLYALLDERRPSAFEVRFEVPLSKEPQRADFLLLRRTKEGDISDARVLRRLWGLIRQQALVEYKSVSASLEPGDLTKLLGYGAQYSTFNRDRLEHKQDLLLVLMVPSMTPTLRDELNFLDAKLGAVKAGYAPIKGLCFPAYAVFVDEVALVERDQLVGMFGHGTSLEGADRWWWINHLWNREGVMANVNLEDMEGYDELTAKFLASLPVELRLKGLATEDDELMAKFLASLPVDIRLKGLATEDRLKGLATEDRLRGLATEDRLKGLATEELRVMLEEVRRRLKEQE